MNKSKIQNLGLSLILFLGLISCDNNTSTSSTLIDIKFSTSPIELGNIDAQFAADIPYDEDEKNTFDIFIPTSSSQTGLVIFIHGGGFVGGDKNFIYNGDDVDAVRKLLTNGFAVASINYRLFEDSGYETEGVLKSLNDSKRAIQYIRYISNELNINKNNIVFFGESAGAGTALWLGANDDFADPNDQNPILQESTRVKGIALRETLCSYNFEDKWINDAFIDFGIPWVALFGGFNAQILQFYGVSSNVEYESTEIDEYRDEVDLLELFSDDDPEIWASNNRRANTVPTDENEFTHHPFHVREIQEYALAAGITITCEYGNPIIFQDQNFEENYVDFLIRKLNE